jgi:hypothetical protein
VGRIDGCNTCPVVDRILRPRAVCSVGMIAKYEDVIVFPAGENDRTNALGGIAGKYGLEQTR